jgi:hypothetical protein
MAETTITIKIEDRPEGTRINIDANIEHDYQHLYSAMGYATWSVVGSNSNRENNVRLTAGDWLPTPVFVDN